MERKLEAAECLKHFRTQHRDIDSLVSELVKSPPVYVYWNKYGGPVNWQSRAVTEHRLHCAYKRTDEDTRLKALLLMARKLRLSNEEQKKNNVESTVLRSTAMPELSTCGNATPQCESWQAQMTPVFR